MDESLEQSINHELDEALRGHPEAWHYREALYRAMIAWYAEHGEMPRLDLFPRTSQE